MLFTLIWLISIASAQSENEFLKRDTTEIQESIKAASQPLADWIQSTNQKQYDLLCLGETHEDFFREFYATVLKDLEFKKLAVEATNEEWTKLKQDWSTTQQVKLLNANFAPIMQTILSKGPQLQVLPVEATADQDKLETMYTVNTGKAHLSRDGFIAQNIVSQMKTGEKVVALYGRNHCSQNNTGLGSVSFANYIGRSKKVLRVMLAKRRSPDKPNLLATLVDAGVEGAKQVMVVDSSKIHDEDHNFNWELKTTLDNFDYIIIY